MAHITPSMHHRIHQMVRFRLKFIEQVIYLPSTHLKSMTLAVNSNKILSLQVSKLLQHGVGNRYDTAVGLETSLGGDHIGKLRGEIHV